MSSDISPPLNSLRPPPYVRRAGQRKPSTQSPTRPTSRELLTEALRRARRAVDLDTSESDVRAAIAAYDDAIALLQLVIERRSQKPGVAGEVERVKDIHGRYVERVRELCHTRRIPLPSHVAAVPTPTPPVPAPPASSGDLPMTTTMTSHLPHIIRPPSPDSPPLSRAAFIGRLKLKHRRPHPTYDKNDGDDSTEQENPGLSSSSSSSTSPTPSTRSPISPIPPVDNDDGPPGDGAGDGTKGSVDGQRWILSPACDEELKEWGLYLGNAVEESSDEENRRRLSGDTAASYERWSAIAASCGECVR